MSPKKDIARATTTMTDNGIAIGTLVALFSPMYLFSTIIIYS